MASESETMLAEVNKIEELIAAGEIGAHGVFTRMRYMLRKALESRAPSAEAKDAMRTAGAMLANCAFNLAQRGHLTADERRSLDESRRAWDAAIAQQGAAAAQEVGRG